MPLPPYYPTIQLILTTIITISFDFYFRCCTTLALATAGPTAVNLSGNYLIHSFEHILPSDD